MRDRVAAFNTHDLDHLLAYLSADTPWVTGTAIAPAAPPNSRSCSIAQSRTCAQTDIKNMVIDGNEVACELSEHLVIDGATRVDHIAGSFLSVAARCASR